MKSPQQMLAPPVSKRWLLVAIVAVLTVTAGFALPNALPAVAEHPKATSVAEPEPVSKLAYDPPTIPDAPDPRAMLMRLAVATAFVLALCAGTFWLGKRWLGVASNRHEASSQLRLVETLALGNRCCVHLVHVANRQVLIAADSSGLKSVVSLPDLFEHTLAAASAAHSSPDERAALTAQSLENTVATNEETAHGRYN